MENNTINLPPESILFLPNVRPRNNFFNSELIQVLQKKDANKDDEQKDKLIKSLDDILKCCICLDYLDKPMNDPTCCEHSACKACLAKYFQILNSKIIPCPLCRRLIKEENLVEIPIVNSIKGLLKDDKNSRMEYNNLKLEEKCKYHPSNKIFYICLNCQIKMCPICNEERKKHENHQLVNYERYAKLFMFIQTSFKGIKLNISEIEAFIKEYKDLYILLEQQKCSYLKCLNDLYLKIQKIYKENQEHINKKIGESMLIIAKYRNFMTNIKSYISSQFKKPYDDIENIEDIEREIKKKVDKLKLKEINKNENINMKNKSLKNLNLIMYKTMLMSFDKKQFIDFGRVACYVDEKNNNEFALELSKDKKLINVYLDIKKKIDNQSNNSSYVVFIEYGLNQKRLYLESAEVNKNFYTYEKILPTKELTDNNETEIKIKLKILSINLE